MYESYLCLLLSTQPSFRRSSSVDQSLFSASSPAAKFYSLESEMSHVFILFFLSVIAHCLASEKEADVAALSAVSRTLENQYEECTIDDTLELADISLGDDDVVNGGCEYEADADYSVRCHRRGKETCCVENFAILKPGTVDADSFVELYNSVHVRILSYRPGKCYCGYPHLHFRNQTWNANAYVSFFF